MSYEFQNKAIGLNTAVANSLVFNFFIGFTLVLAMKHSKHYNTKVTVRETMGTMERAQLIHRM